ncbi:uncharacterized protein LOC143186922 [Calliopsis andreniformis]|uniref:uncharacterized protein LOC143186922 n=1 Tax=Calliopsis andreniformis TaxID=337506 RepID=UPI003FCD5FD7
MLYVNVNSRFSNRIFKRNQLGISNQTSSSVLCRRFLIAVSPRKIKRGGADAEQRVAKARSFYTQRLRRPRRIVHDSRGGARIHLPTTYLLFLSSVLTISLSSSLPVCLSICLSQA